MNFAGDRQLYIGFVKGNLMTPHPQLLMKDTKFTTKYFISNEVVIWESPSPDFIMEAIHIQENRYKKNNG